MFDRLKHIADGWGKTLGLLEVSDEERRLSNARLDVCSSCEHAKESKVLMMLKTGMKPTDVIYCTKCSCPCNEKSLTKDVCPLGKWNHLKQINTAA